MFEIEENLHNKQLGRNFMKKYKETEILATEQYGSWASKSTDIQALNTRMSYDLILIKSTPAKTVFHNWCPNMTWCLTLYPL